MNPNDKRVVKASLVLILVIVVGFMLLFGGIFAAVGLFIRNGIDKAKENCTVSVEAEVTQMYPGSNEGMTPVYSYTYEGRELTFHNNFYSDHPPYNVGDKAELMIDPDEPERAFVPADKSMYMVCTVFMTVGFCIMGAAGLLVFGAAVTLFVAKKKSAEAKRENLMQ